MKLDYTLYALIYPLLFALLTQLVPDLPGQFSSVVFEALFSYILTKLGVEIVGAPIRAAFVARGFKSFAKK